MANKSNAHGNENTERIGRLIAMTAWLAGLGRTIWTANRWRKLGWIHPINIAGKLYMRADDIEQFEQRAERGELSRPLVGSAKLFADKKAAKEVAA